MKMYAVLLLCFVALAAITVEPVTADGNASTPEDAACEKHAGNCKECVKESAQCFYCTKNDKCFYTKATKLDADDRCGSLKDMKQLTCFANKLWLYVGIGIGGGILLIIITAICCCCCCKKKKNVTNMKDWLKWERIRENRTAQREEQRAERQNRMDDIRRKYGIEERKYDRSITTGRK